MTAPTGQISLLDIQNEFGGSSPISLSEYYALAGYVPGGQSVPASGVISFNDLRGKTKVVDLTATASTTLYNVNVRDALIAAGWDKNAPAIYRIPATTKIFSKRTDTAALLITGDFPGGLTIVNSGKILGKGGQGGYNYGGFSAGGGPGEAGGAAIDVRSSCTINNLGTIGGGGGGGGAAGSPSAAASYWVQSGGGGGGAGGDPGAAGTSGHWVAPTAGNEVTGGNYGVGYASVTGGLGGDLGKDGGAGGTGTNGGAGGGSGGRSGRAVVGSEYVTWTAYGTLKGGIRQSTWVSLGGFTPEGHPAPTNAEWSTWGPLGYGSNSNYLYAFIYSRTVYGDYPAADFADNDFYGPISLSTANSQTFDWKLFGKTIKMTSYASDSGLFVSTNSYVGVHQGVYDISKSAEWCVEGWFYPIETGWYVTNGYAAGQTLINLSNNSVNAGLHVWRNINGNLVVDDGQTGRAAFTGGSNKKIVAGQWTHVCIERQGTDVYAYLDGVYVGKHVNMNAYPDHINSYKIGCLTQQYTWHFYGYASNVRVSKVARYNYGASNFTPRTIPFTVSSSDTNTVLLACTTSNVTYDASNYRVTARATGSGVAQGGYSRDTSLAGSTAPSATTAQYPFSGGGWSAYFPGPGAAYPYNAATNKYYGGYGILDFPGKINGSVMSSTSFTRYAPVIDRIVVCGSDLKSGYYTMQAGCSPYYNSTAAYTSLSYNGASTAQTPSTGWGTIRVQWQMQFYDPALFGGKMVVGISTAPIGSTGPFGSALTAWTRPGVSYIASADGSEYLDFSNIINGPGQSVVLIGDSEGRNWQAYKGAMKWSNVTNKAFSVEPSLLNYDKT